jgi:hypothetical protein
MAISYPLTPPSVFTAAKMSIPMIRRRAGVARSPFTGQQTVYEWSAEYWVADITTPVMLRETGGATLEAFLNSLHGPVGTFLWGPPYATTRRGTANATGVTVNGASQTGRALNVTGLGGALTILQGTFFQLGTGASTHLHQVVADATSAADGTATLTIEPALRASPANGDSVIFNSPQALWRLVQLPTPTMTGQGGNGNLYESFTISIEEAL